MALPADTLQKMLAAAEGQAQSVWQQVSGKVTTIAQNILDDSKTTAEQLAAGEITEAEAKVQIEGIRDEIDMATYFAEEALKIAAQDAINAAVDVLWAAVKGAAGA